MGMGGFCAFILCCLVVFFCWKGNTGREKMLDGACPTSLVG